MKIYKTELYEISYTPLITGFLVPVDTVIVQKTLFGAKEVLTGANIQIIPAAAANQRYVSQDYLNFTRHDKYGHHFVLFRESLSDDNIATETDIAHYVNRYSKSNFKKVYESTKGFVCRHTEPPKVKIKGVTYEEVRRG